MHRFVAAATGLAVAGAAAVTATLTAGGQVGTHPGYGNATELAATVGCSATFRPVVAPVGEATAGTCRVGKATVELVTFASPSASFAWLDGLRSAGRAQPYASVGAGWAVEATSSSALGALSNLGS